jgi:hypothetical protein
MLFSCYCSPYFFLHGLPIVGKVRPQCRAITISPDEMNSTEIVVLSVPKITCRAEECLENESLADANSLAEAGVMAGAKFVARTKFVAQAEFVANAEFVAKAKFAAKARFSEVDK